MSPVSPVFLTVESVRFSFNSKILIGTQSSLLSIACSVAIHLTCLMRASLVATQVSSQECFELIQYLELMCPERDSNHRDRESSVIRPHALPQSHHGWITTTKSMLLVHSSCLHNAAHCLITTWPFPDFLLSFCQVHSHPLPSRSVVGSDGILTVQLIHSFSM